MIVEKPIIEQGPLKDAHLRNAIRENFAKDSPLSLLPQESQPQTAPVIDPQGIANRIAVKQEMEKIEQKNPDPSLLRAMGAVIDDAQNKQGTDIPGRVEVGQQASAQPSAEGVRVSDGTRDLTAAFTGDSGDSSSATGTTPPDANAGTIEEDPIETSPEDISKETPDQQALRFKTLRAASRELKKQHKELKEQFTAAKTRVDEFETGAAIPTLLQDKELEIERLRTYEALVNVKGSPMYKERIVDPLNQLGSQLKGYSEKYNIPEETFIQAIGIQNELQLNQFLSRKFDPATALEVKNVVTKMQGIQQEAAAMDAQPQQAFQFLHDEHTRIAQEQDAGRRSAIHDTAQSAWIKTIRKIEAEGTVPELIPIAGDSNHNEKVVQVLRGAAAKQYGTFVRHLADLGLKELPTGLAEALATACALSQGVGTAIVSREKWMNKAEGLQKDLQRTAPMWRPSIGSQGGTGPVNVNAGAASKPAATPRAEGARQLQDLGLAQGG